MINVKILKTVAKIIRKPNINTIGLVDAAGTFDKKPVRSNPKINVVIGTVKRNAKKNAAMHEIKKNNAVNLRLFNGSSDSNFNKNTPPLFFYYLVGSIFPKSTCNVIKFKV